jgi:predicted ATPase
LFPRRPLVLAIEDVHWGDQATEEFLTFLLDHMAGSRLLLVFTYRPEFVSTWSRKSYHSVITLTRLTQSDCRQMLMALLGTTRIQDELVAKANLYRHWKHCSVLLRVPGC